MSKLLSVMVFLVLSGSVGLVSSTYQYVVLAVFGLVSLVFFEKSRIPNLMFIDFIPFLIFCCWVYGVFVAVIKGVEVGNVFRNFFGMTVYLFYYYFVFFKVEKELLWKALLLAAIFNISYAMYYFSAWVMTDGIIDNDGVNSYSSRFRSYYSTGIMVLFPVLSFLVFSRFSGFQRYIKPIAGFYFWIPYLVMSFVIVFTTFSKGFILAYVFLHIVILSILVFRSLFVKKNYISSWALGCSLMLVGGLVLTQTDVGRGIQHMYSSEEQSNNVRNIQRQHLISEYSLEGAGLGARLKSGYERDPRGYGFETTYENVIHKLGFVSIFVFLGLLLPLIISIKNLFFYKNVFFSSLSLGLMLYIIPSLGNPMLFSPMFVIMHVLSIYFLRKLYG